MLSVTNALKDLMILCDFYALALFFFRATAVDYGAREGLDGEGMEERVTQKETITQWRSKRG